MQYYFSKVLDNVSFQEAVEKATEALKTEGFGVLTQIDVRETLKKKINADFRPYLILGACNPHFAHKALLAEDKLGVFLPCNVVVEQLDDGRIEIAAVDPMAMMMSVTNEKMEPLAAEVRLKMQRVMNLL